MNEIDLRRELKRAGADVRRPTDPQILWASGARLRRRRHAIVVAGTAAAAAAIAVTGMAVQALDSASPGPRPASRTPIPPDNSFEARDSVPYLTEDQVRPMFDPADLASVPWDPTSSVRSWDPVDPVPLTEDPVEHAAVAVQSDGNEPDAISVLGDDGRWRSLDVAGLEFTDSIPKHDLGVTRGSLSPDGTQLALGQTDGVVVIDLTTGARSTYDVPGLGPRWHGRMVTWSADTATVYIGGASDRAVDLATGRTHSVPFGPGSVFLDDGRVVEYHFSMRSGYEIRVYDSDEDLVFRSANTDMVLGWLQYETGRGDRWAAQRIQTNWDRADPRTPNAPASGVLIMDADARPAALLPVKGYNQNGGGGAVMGWRGDNTVLFRVYPQYETATVLAWNIESGRITRIANYHPTSRDVSVAADYLPTP